MIRRNGACLASVLLTSRRVVSMFLQTKAHLAVFKEHLQRSKEQGVGPVNPNAVHEEFKARLGFNGKVATVLTGVYGSMYFVYFLALFMAGWMTWQSIMGKAAFDPYPFLLLDR